MATCAECGNKAMSKCAICGKSLCNDHVTHGMSMRTNDPVVNCSNCQKKFPRKIKKNILIMFPILIITAIIIIVYLSTIIPFGL